jgi:hypothetical protein
MEESVSKPFDTVGEWRAYTKRNPLPDPWWPLAFKNNFADVARTHPCAFGVWDERDGTYTVAIKAEAMRGLTGWNLPDAGVSQWGGAREVKRKRVSGLLELRTLLITLAKHPNTVLTGG